MLEQNRSLKRLAGSLCLAALALLLSHAPAAGQDHITHTIARAGQPGFEKFAQPTTLAIGPTGRLFTGQANGRIHAIDFDGLRVTNVRVIDTIYNRGLGTNGRLVTGIAIGPLADLFVSHSDGRRYDPSIDDASGTVTRLFASTGYATGVDLVTGLPRSKADHAPNGLAVGPDGALYLAIGGLTNAGLPSDFFFNQAEQPLSSAILRIDVYTGQVTPYATGFRNPYDLVWHSNGQLYATDNGANGGLGPRPNTDCSAGPDPGTQPDELNRVVEGMYYGHPNPSRGQCFFNGGFEIFMAPLATFGASENGLAEYNSSRVPAFRGNLFAANFNTGEIHRVQLSRDGARVVGVTTYASGFDGPLDLRVSLDGRMYVAEFGGNALKVILPVVSFRSVNGFYVVAENGGGDVVNANRAAIGPWERFALIDLNSGMLRSGDAVHLLAADGVHYVVAEGGGAPEGTPLPNGRVYANRTEPREWETFIIRKADGTAGVITHNDQITLQSDLGYYVVAQDGGAPEGTPPPAGEVYANRPAAGPWETFTLGMQ